MVFGFQRLHRSVVGQRRQRLSARQSSRSSLEARLGDSIEMLESRQMLSVAPGSLLIYYAFPSGINSTFNVAGAANEFAKYQYVVLGAGLEQTSHQDHANTVSIVNSPLTANTKFFGYVDLGVSTSNFLTAELHQRMDLWKATGADGIFLDDYGYDFGVSRSRQNDAVDYAHSIGLPVVANGFVVSDVFGKTIDATHNPGGTATHLQASDYYLYESYQVSEGNFVLESQWRAKADALAAVRATLPISVLAATTNSAANTFDQAAFNYGWTSALLDGFTGFSWGEYQFAANTGSVPFRQRPADIFGNQFTSAVVATSPTYSRSTDVGKVTVDATHHTELFSAGPMLSGLETLALIPTGTVPVNVTASLKLIDAASSTIAGATVSISSGYVAGADSLRFSNTAKITGKWNSSTGVLTLSGTDTVANYQVALRSIQIQNMGSNTGARKVSFKVNDGSIDSNVVSRVVDAAPKVLSLAPATASPAIGSAVQFALRFSESVTGLSAAAFDLVENGVTGGVIAVSGSGATYTLTVTGLVGHGTIGVTLSRLTTIIDAGGSSVSTGFAGSLLTLQQMGDLDTSYGNAGQVISDWNSTGNIFQDMAVQKDGKAVLTGFTVVNGNNDFVVARYLTDGTPDLTFGKNGIVTIPIGTGEDNARSVVIQNDGKILIAGQYMIYTIHSQTADIALVRLNTNGALDTTFGDHGIMRQAVTTIDTSVGGNGVDDVFDMALQSDGKIVVACQSMVSILGLPFRARFVTVRFNTNGSLDTGFANQGYAFAAFGSSDLATRIAIQADDKIVIGGYSYIPSDNEYEFALARYDKNGALDTSFGGDGLVVIDPVNGSSFLTGLAVQTDGKILVSGYSMNPQGLSLIRLKTDGTLDPSFNGNGKAFVAMDGRSQDIAIQTDNKILVSGFAGSSNRGDRGNAAAVLRFNTNGTLDQTFGVGGVDIQTWNRGTENAQSIAVLSSGKILIAGGVAGNTGLMRLIGTKPISDIRVNSAVVNGSTITVNYTITGIAVPAFELRFARSPDSPFNQSDSTLASFQISDPAQLSAGVHVLQYNVGTASGAVPLPGTAGADTNQDYHILVVADPTDALGEVDVDPVNDDNTAVLNGVYAIGGVVYALGSDAPDTINVAATATTFDVNLNGIVYSYPLGSTTGFRIRSGSGADTINVANIARPTALFGGDGDDRLTGGAGNDVLVGGNGNDILQGGIGINSYDGGGGDDTFNFAVRSLPGTNDKDSIVDSGGSNTLSMTTFTSGLKFNLAVGSGTAQVADAVTGYRLDLPADAIQTVLLGSGDNIVSGNPHVGTTIVGGIGNDRLTGGAGDDVLNGGGGNDSLSGGAGSNTLDGGDGNDTYTFSQRQTAGSDQDTVIDSSGADVLTFATFTHALGVNLQLISPYRIDAVTLETIELHGIFETVIGGSGNDNITGNATVGTSISGGAGNNTLIGGSGNDTLTGGTGNDTLIGFGGNDTLSGGTGTNTLNGGDGNDLYQIAARTNLGTDSDQVIDSRGSDYLSFQSFIHAVTVNLQTAGSQTVDPLTGDTITLKGTFESVVGGAGNDTITGNAALRTLINGGAGDDILIGGSSNDGLTGGIGNDVLVGLGGADSLDGGDGNDVLIGGQAADTLIGGIGNDLLIGGTTSFDANLAALTAIHTEWITAASDYATAVGHLLGTTSGGANGNFNLTSATVIDDGVKDSMTGGSANDWFWAFGLDSKDAVSGEYVNSTKL